MKLTEVRIRGLTSAGKGRVDFADDKSPGLRLRVTANGSKSWSFLYRPKAGAGGAPERRTIGRWPDVSLAEARDAAYLLRKEKAAGRNPQAEHRADAERGRLTVDELFDRYLSLYAEPSLKASTVKQDRLLLGLARAAWPRRGAASITKADIVALLDTRMGGKGVTANRLRSTLAKVFAWGCERDLIERSPVAGVKKPRRETAKTRVLSEPELRLFLETLRDPTCPCEDGVALAYQLILATGARPGEIAGLPHAELTLDGDAPTWTLEAKRAKSGKERTIPLSRFALAAIGLARKVGAKRPGGDVWLFPSKYRPGDPLARHSLSQALGAVRAADKLPPFVPHDLRRTAATIAGNLGSSDDAIGRLLGHAPATITGKVYDHSRREAEVRAAADAIGGYLKSLITRQAGKREAARRLERHKAAPAP